MGRDKPSINIYRFGVNYVPSRNWWYCWNDFDASAISHDFDAIVSLGLDHLRIFPIWPTFQPNPNWVSPAHLDRLEILMGLAGERGLDVCVTPLTGWLSGYHFCPPFQGNESIYTSDKLLAAQELYFVKLASVLNSFDNFLGFDLGNEINCYERAPVADGDVWLERMLAHCETISPQKIHVNGVDHQPWFTENTFSAHLLAHRQDILALHCWIFFTGALDRGGPLDPPAIQLAPAMASLARAYAGDPSKPIWVQEFGTSTQWMPEKNHPDFVTKSTFAMIDAGISWITWWCSHDINPCFKFDTLEYDLGLMTTDNKPKPRAIAMKEIAEAYAGKPVRAYTSSLMPPPTSPDYASTWNWLLDWIGTSST